MQRKWKRVCERRGRETGERRSAREGVETDGSIGTADWEIQPHLERRLLTWSSKEHWDITWELEIHLDQFLLTWSGREHWDIKLESARSPGAACIDMEDFEICLGAANRLEQLR
ncbi:hypothetical protein chiPu_0014978 [Chiloscyllium punctatum]|uniref:Uncharacterized protein n=1 Tax=Chiloscyllium punctatum TaxID=137246 RepID=A0A401T1I7_CHIPU|nr:hypothetical protein [Chiloscyllium punctatum]